MAGFFTLKWLSLKLPFCFGMVRCFDVKICSSSRTEVSQNAVLYLKQVENVTVQFNSLTQLLLHRQNQNIWTKLFFPFLMLCMWKCGKCLCVLHTDWLIASQKRMAFDFLFCFVFLMSIFFFSDPLWPKGYINRERLAAKQQPETIKCQRNSAACSDDAIMSKWNNCKEGGYWVRLCST